MPLPPAMFAVTAMALVAILGSNHLSAASLSATDEAQQLDQIIAAARDQYGLTANLPTDDATFIRRAWLDLGGRLPTYQEYLSAMEPPASTRRSQLIDRLVGSPAFHSHRFNQIADLLRIKHKLARRVPGAPYIAWLKKRIAANQPWDEMVAELITAEGAIWDKDNGAVGFHLRDRGMNEDHTALTVQVFLGVRIECAQCHDDPDGSFSRRQFLELAAYEHGVDTRRPVLHGTIPKAVRALTFPGQRHFRELRTLLGTTSSGITNTHKKKKIPAGYQYDNGRPGDILEPAPLWGEVNSDDPRQAFAQWVIHEDRHQFAAVLANRIWASLMGRGLVEPLDDWDGSWHATTYDDETTPIKTLITHLTDLVIRADYDVEALYRILARTEVYGLKMSEQLDPQTPPLAGPVMRRLSAEQIWDSLIALTIPNPDDRLGKKRPNFESLRTQVAQANADALVRIAGDAADAIALRPKAMQALNQARSNYQKALRKNDQKLIQKQYKIYVKAHQSIEHLFTMAALDWQIPPFKDVNNPWHKYPPLFVRASETEQPAPPNHFLRIFGQSDRETVNAASTDSTILQALTFMNGAVDHMVLHKHSVFRQQLTTITNHPIDALFQRLLFRSATEAERKALLPLLKTTAQHDQVALEDATWAIVNSPEFIHYR